MFVIFCPRVAFLFPWPSLIFLFFRCISFLPLWFFRCICLLWRLCFIRFTFFCKRYQTVHIENNWLYRPLLNQKSKPFSLPFCIELSLYCPFLPEDTSSAPSKVPNPVWIHLDTCKTAEIYTPSTVSYLTHR